MTAYEYRVIPAPAKGVKAKGVKTPEDRFAHALQELMNRMGEDGWEYQRAETLPATERAGLTGTTTNWRHVLIFRRAQAEPAQETENKREKIVGPLISPPRAPANDPGRSTALPGADRPVAETAKTPREEPQLTLKNPERSDI